MAVGCAGAGATITLARWNVRWRREGGLAMRHGAMEEGVGLRLLEGLSPIVHQAVRAGRQGCRFARCQGHGCRGRVSSGASYWRKWRGRDQDQAQDDYATHRHPQRESCQTLLIAETAERCSWNQTTPLAATQRLLVCLRPGGRRDAGEGLRDTEGVWEGMGEMMGFRRACSAWSGGEGVAAGRAAFYAAARSEQPLLCCLAVARHEGAWVPDGLPAHAHSLSLSPTLD